MPATEAVTRMQLPPGFRATVFAAEPDLQNPIAMAWDARGRLWVAENYTYAEGGKSFDLNLRDRILIFEDKDGDGRFDTRKVFTDEVQMLTSIEVGRGGVWVTCPPEVLFNHWHFDTAEGWSKSRGQRADALGGGHAHVGMMIYLGDNWPSEYRGHLFTVNLHGRRANQEILERSGSGYVGRHAPDFFLADELWFRGMEFSYRPDGG